MIRLRGTNFDWQIGLIGLSAIISLLIAYNPTAALFQFTFIAIGIVLYLVLANVPDPVLIGKRARSVLSGFLAALPTAIAIYFLLTNDWSLWAGKVPAFGPLLSVFVRWPLSSSGLGANPNVIGGVLAALLPLQIFALRHSRRSIRILLLAITMTGVILSQTRGAWLALLLVAGLWLAWNFLTARSANLRRARIMWLSVVVLACITVIVMATFTPLGDRLLGLGGDRRNIWQNSTALIGDYPLTGLGFAGFEMAYSTYSLLVHVGYITHAHNLWLDAWLNQGWLGVIALAGLVLNAVWPKPSSTWRTPALLALGVMLLHSLIDDPYYGYGSSALPLIFIPLGLLARPPEVNTADELPVRTGFQPACIVWGPAMIVLAAGLIVPNGRAVLEANLGALAQTQAELSAYRWPEIPIQDALRRSGPIDLAPAEQHYQNALALDPGNVTANRRLGQIELARGRYDVACRHLVAAYASDPQQRATRQLLGECYALQGQIDQATQLWRTIDMSEGQLQAREWWYTSYLGEPQRAIRIGQAAAALGNH